MRSCSIFRLRACAFFALVPEGVDEEGLADGFLLAEVVDFEVGVEPDCFSFPLLVVGVPFRIPLPL